MQLIIDIGNTLSKIARFEGRTIQGITRVEHAETHEAIEQMIQETPPDVIGFANVNAEHLDLPSPFLGVPAYNVKTCPLPITLSYATPASLGIDRLCGAVAASARYPDQAVLSIDLGTCITYDLTVNGDFKGGGIAPGYAMRLKAMHRFTERLPEVKANKELPYIGTDTAGSMLFGAGRGMVAEINGIIAHFKTSYPELKVILTGGDQSTFEQHVENPIFAAPNLVLEGINEILLHHIAQSN